MDPVERWLRSARNQSPLLTAAEEVHLGNAVRAWLDDPDPSPLVVRRGRRARNRMLTANLRLVVAVSRRYRAAVKARGLMMEDLLQEGVLGLNRAVEKFDPARGYKFSTYAYWWIRQAIGRAISTSGTIRVPIPYSEALPNMTPEKLAAMPPAQQERFQAAANARALSSLDGVVPQADGDVRFIDVVADSSNPDQWEVLETAERWESIAALLTPEEQTTVELVAGMGSREAGQILGLHAGTVTARMRAIKARFGVA